MSPQVAICFLVVNKMEVLPELSITSASNRTNAKILIGYLDDSDLPLLPSGVDVKLIQLENPEDLGLNQLGGSYSDFSQDDFYRIVQLKWQLLEKALLLDYDFVIYSDTDVYWNVSPIPEIMKVFSNRNNVSVLIQSFSDLPSDPKLCMGFVAFRNSPISRNFIIECKSRHSMHALNLGRIGDDDIVTQFYLENNFPEFIQELPQTTFPVGRMLKLYAPSSRFPGLPSPEPFIFHANYVVGLRNKIILMKIFMRQYSKYDRNVSFGAKSFLILLVLRLRLKLGFVKKFLFKKFSK